MSAIGRDGNDQIFLAVLVVVEGENNSSWNWFIESVRNCLELGDDTGMCVLSDEH